jgi:hypothetical protein
MRRLSSLILLVVFAAAGAGIYLAGVRPARSLPVLALNVSSGQVRLVGANGERLFNAGEVANPLPEHTFVRAEGAATLSLTGTTVRLAHDSRFAWAATAFQLDFGQFTVQRDATANRPLTIQTLAATVTLDPGTGSYTIFVGGDGLLNVGVLTGGATVQKGEAKAELREGQGLTVPRTGSIGAPTAWPRLTFSAYGPDGRPAMLIAVLHDNPRRFRLQFLTGETVIVPPNPYRLYVDLARPYLLNLDLREGQTYQKAVTLAAVTGTGVVHGRLTGAEPLGPEQPVLIAPGRGRVVAATADKPLEVSFYAVEAATGSQTQLGDSAADPSGAVQVVLTGDDGQPITGAPYRVYPINAEAGGPIAVLQAGRDILRLPAGRYIVMAGASPAARAEVAIEKDKVTTVQVRYGATQTDMRDGEGKLSASPILIANKGATEGLRLNLLQMFGERYAAPYAVWVQNGERLTLPEGNYLIATADNWGRAQTLTVKAGETVVFRP